MSSFVEVGLVGRVGGVGCGVVSCGSGGISVVVVVVEGVVVEVCSSVLFTT